MVAYAGGAWAQELGSRVRVRHDTTEVIGTLIHLDTDSIVVRSDSTVYHQGRLVKEEVALPVTVDTRMDISTGRHSNAKKGALIGGGVGLGVTALFTLASIIDGGENSWVPLPGAMFVGGVLLFVVPGSLIGFAIGSQTTWDTWEEVPLDSPSRTDPYEVTEGVIRLGLRVNF